MKTPSHLATTLQANEPKLAGAGGNDLPLRKTGFRPNSPPASAYLSIMMQSLPSEKAVAGKHRS